MRQIFVDKGRVDFIVFKDVLHRVSKWTGLHVVQHCCGDDVASDAARYAVGIAPSLGQVENSNGVLESRNF